MRLSDRVEFGRQRTGELSSRSGDSFGAFFIHGPCGEKLKIIVSDGVAPADDPLGGWEHVSVSIRRRLPNWIEMSFVKDLFWAPEECVVQYHPPQSEYINNHPNCLHLWRPRDGQFPMPPTILVGLKEVGEIKSPEQARAICRAAGLS